MDWVRQNYERAALVAAGLFLLLCAIFIFLRTSHFEVRLRTIQAQRAPDNEIPKSRVAALTDALHKLKMPAQWISQGRSGLFVPEKHFIGKDGQPITLHDAVLHPPVPNEWLEEFGLPLTEVDVLALDSDGDGFTNFEEWSGQTNPIAEASHPPYTTMLKLKSFQQEQFPLIFSSSIGDTYAINNTDLSMPTQFLKVGDRIEGTQFKITGYSEKFETARYGTRIDISELTLEQIGSHNKVTLVKEQPAVSPETVAHFLYTWGRTDQIFSVKKDHQFTLQPEDAIKYKLVQVHPDKAIIVNPQKPNEQIEIPLLKP
jgi:hypothetical protein